MLDSEGWEGKKRSRNQSRRKRRRDDVTRKRLTLDPDLEFVVSYDRTSMTVFHELKPVPKRSSRVVEKISSREGGNVERRRDATHSDRESDIRLNISSTSDLQREMKSDGTRSAHRVCLLDDVDERKKRKTRTYRQHHEMLWRDPLSLRRIHYRRS